MEQERPRSLLLLRHAPAAQYKVDAQRPLTNSGRLLAARAGKRNRVCQDTQIFCSPTTRSVETAKFLVGSDHIEPIIVPELLLGPGEIHLAGLLRLFETSGYDASYQTWEKNPHFEALRRLGTDLVEYFRRQFTWGWWPTDSVVVGHMSSVAFLAHHWRAHYWDDKIIPECAGVNVGWNRGNNEFSKPDCVEAIFRPI